MEENYAKEVGETRAWKIMPRHSSEKVKGNYAEEVDEEDMAR